LSSAHQVDVGLAVDLPAAQEEGIDATACRAVMQLAIAIRKEHPRARQYRNSSLTSRLQIREPGCRTRWPRGRTDRNVARSLKESCKGYDDQLVGAAFHTTASLVFNTNSAKYR